MPKNQWGGARVEFLALQGEIEKRIESGRSVRSVYMDLCNENKITMTYTTFYRHCRKANFVVGSNVDFETLQSSRLTPEEEQQRKANERILRAAREAQLRKEKAQKNG